MYRDLIPAQEFLLAMGKETSNPCRQRGRWCKGRCVSFGGPWSLSLGRGEGLGGLGGLQGLPEYKGS